MDICPLRGFVAWGGSKESGNNPSKQAFILFFPRSLQIGSFSVLSAFFFSPPSCWKFRSRDLHQGKGRFLHIICLCEPWLSLKLKKMNSGGLCCRLQQEINEGTPADYPAYSLILALWIQTGSTRKAWMIRNIGEEMPASAQCVRLWGEGIRFQTGASSWPDGSSATMTGEIAKKLAQFRGVLSSVSEKGSDGHGESPHHLNWCNKSKTWSLSGSCHWSHIHTPWIIYTVLERTQLSIPESLFIEHLIMAIYSTYTSHTLCFLTLWAWVDLSLHIYKSAVMTLQLSCQDALSLITLLVFTYSSASICLWPLT